MSDEPFGLSAIWCASKEAADKGQVFGVASLLLGSVAAIGAAVGNDGTATLPVFSAIAVFVGTVLTMWSSGVRTRHADREISNALARIAEANADTAKAQLQLERMRAPRDISADQALSIRDALALHQGQQFSGLVSDASPDARPLWRKIAQSLQSAGWQLVGPRGLTIGDPPAGVPIAPGVGITVFAPVHGQASVQQASNNLRACLEVQGLLATLAYHQEADRDAIIAIEIGTRSL